MLTQAEIQDQLAPFIRGAWPHWRFTTEQADKVWHKFSKYTIDEVLTAFTAHHHESDLGGPKLNAIADAMRERYGFRGDTDDEYERLGATLDPTTELWSAASPRLQRAWSFCAAYPARAKALGSLSDIADALEAEDRYQTSRRRRIRLADAQAAEVPTLSRLWWRERFQDLSDAEIIARWEGWKQHNRAPEFNPEGPQQAPSEAVPF